jgi:pimeloyl-ACP methyl ester carboxylesterase
MPPQPAKGPGGAEYPCAGLVVVDSSARAGGYWIYQAAEVLPDTAPLVVFLHGFGCYNPMIYGKWIRHLVGKGNVVIMPRYQDRLLHPRARDFSAVVAGSVQRAMDYLRQHSATPVGFNRPVVIGHSYGGVLAADLLLHFSGKNLPKPAAVMICQAGINIFRGGRIRDYEGFPEDVNLLLVVAKNDLLVSRRISKQIYRHTTHLKNRDLLILNPDRHGRPHLAAGHRACHATDRAFDNGVRTFSARYALFQIPTDAADYYGYWKLADALIDCTLRGANCEYAFGGGPAQTGLGHWSDGKAVEPMRHWTPD